MANWNTAKKPVSGGGNNVERFSLSKDLKAGESVKLRLVGDYVARYQYWIKNNEDSFRTVDCLSFNPETEVFDGAPDSLSGKMGPRGEPLKAEFAYAIQAFKEDGTLVVVELKKGAFSDIVGLAQNEEYGNPSDPENGYWVTILKEKTGPLPQNIAYKALGGRKVAPLTDEQKAAELYDLSKLYKRPTFDAQNEWLKENTDYLDDLGTDSGVPEGLGFND